MCHLLISIGAWRLLIQCIVSLIVKFIVTIFIDSLDFTILLVLVVSMTARR